MPNEVTNIPDQQPILRPRVALSSLPPGSTAKVKAVTTLNPLLKSRLLSLGFVGGSMIKIERRAPLGGPFCVKLLGQKAPGGVFALRRSEAQVIEVEAE